MKHPTDKLHRRKIGIKKAKKMEIRERWVESITGRSIRTKVKGIWRDTRKICSNPFCCGNPRRIKGRKSPTIQELKHAYIDEDM